MESAKRIKKTRRRILRMMKKRKRLFNKTVMMKKRVKTL
jgi:hypothetical protein